MPTSFAAWLNEQTEQRNLSYRELARRAGISHTVVSNVANDKQNPGCTFCIQIARALRLPPENVLRRAGILPSLPPAVEQEHEAIAILRSLTPSDRDQALAILRVFDDPKPSAVRDAVSAYRYADTEVEAQILEEFRQLPENWQSEALAEVRRLQRFQQLSAPREEEEQRSRDTEGDPPRL